MNELKWLLVLTSFSGDVQMMHVTKEQCLGAVTYYQSRLSARIVADCFPPDAVYKVEGDRGGKREPHGSGFGREDLPQKGKQ